MLLLLAALPALFWDGAADTAPALRDAGIKQILVPAARLASWKSVGGIAAEAADPQSAVKVLPPTVNYRMNVAAATSSPWIVANGWRFIRRPVGRFYYDVTGKQAALAAAEAAECRARRGVLPAPAAAIPAWEPPARSPAKPRRHGAC